MLIFNLNAICEKKKQDLTSQGQGSENKVHKFAEGMPCDLYHL